MAKVFHFFIEIEIITLKIQYRFLVRCLDRRSMV